MMSDHQSALEAQTELAGDVLQAVLMLALRARRDRAGKSEALETLDAIEGGASQLLMLVQVDGQRARLTARLMVDGTPDQVLLDLGLLHNGVTGIAAAH